MRYKEFERAEPKPIQVNDSRFGIRKLFTTDKEKPNIVVWNQPGKGPNGESQN